MELIFRKAESGDLDGVCALVRASVARMHEYGIYQWSDEYPSRDTFAEDIRRGEMRIGFSEGRMAVIYTLNSEPHPDYVQGNWRYEGPYRVVHRLCVASELQHRGTAKLALRHVEEELTAEGIHTIRLDTFTKNPFAMRLYESLGYEKAGTVEWLPRGTFQLFEKRIR